jgi:Skp family chaperone for outer membrane proteins
MPEQKSDTKVGDIVLYQPTFRDWLRGGGPQIVGIVLACDEESGAATLIVFPTDSCTHDYKRNVTKGDGDGQYMKQGEESKTAKAMKKAAEEAKKAQEERQKKEQEEAKKLQEEAKKPKTAEHIPTQQEQLDQDQKKAYAQYKYPQPPQSEASQ